MDVVIGIFAIVYSIAMFVCAKKESALTGLYKAFGVYGRFKAYIVACLLPAGILSIISGDIAEGIAVLAIGILICWLTYRKCPSGLKAACIPSMIISGLGVAGKVVLFFLPHIWNIIGPEDVYGNDGQKYIRVGANIYNQDGMRVGNISGSDGITVLKDNNGTAVHTDSWL